MSDIVLWLTALVDCIIGFKHAQLDTFFGLPFSYQVIGKSVPLLGVIVTMALMRDPPKMRNRAMRLLRLARYWFCASGIMILGDYADDGYSKSFFLMNFFFSLWGLVLCSIHAHWATPENRETP